MAKEVKERKGKNGVTHVSLADDRYLALTEGGQNRARELGYTGFVYTPDDKGGIDRAHKMIEEGGGVGTVGACMLINYIALKVAEEEQDAKMLNRKGELK